MMNTKPHIAFMSCEVADESEFETYLNSMGLTFVTGLGCYHGTTEKSYLIVLGTEIHLAANRVRKLLLVGTMFDQESILYCDNERTAYLLSCDGIAAPKLGTLQQVALPAGDYSLFNDKYYEVK